MQKNIVTNNFVRPVGKENTTGKIIHFSKYPVKKDVTQIEENATYNNDNNNNNLCIPRT